MCDMCLRTPCPSNCPNAKLPKLIGYCERCGAEIRKDTMECYTDINKNLFCSFECAFNFYDIHKVDLD